MIACTREVMFCWFVHLSAGFLNKLWMTFREIAGRGRTWTERVCLTLWAMWNRVGKIKFVCVTFNDILMSKRAR